MTKKNRCGISVKETKRYPTSNQIEENSKSTSIHNLWHKAFNKNALNLTKLIISMKIIMLTRLLSLISFQCECISQGSCNYM